MGTELLVDLGGPGEQNGGPISWGSKALTEKSTLLASRHLMMNIKRAKIELSCSPGALKIDA